MTDSPGARRARVEEAALVAVHREVEHGRVVLEHALRRGRARPPRSAGASRDGAAVAAGAAAGPRGAGWTWVPLPWWTSQSTMSTRWTPRRRAALAATATLPKSENPIAQWHSAWCPGGRTTATPLRSRPQQTSSVSAT